MFDPGQRYSKHTAFAGFALNFDVPVALFDDSIYGRES